MRPTRCTAAAFVRLATGFEVDSETTWFINLRILDGGLPWKFSKVHYTNEGTCPILPPDSAVASTTGLLLHRFGGSLLLALLAGQLLETRLFRSEISLRFLELILQRLEIRLRRLQRRLRLGFG